MSFLKGEGVRNRCYLTGSTALVLFTSLGLVFRTAIETACSDLRCVYASTIVALCTAGTLVAATNAVASTAPYMQDESAITLREAVDREIYYRNLQSNRPNTLTEQDRQDPVTFLQSLSDLQKK